jgi:hypothetical protein
MKQKRKKKVWENREETGEKMKDKWKKIEGKREGKKKENIEDEKK